ncbi:hypothetical protein GC105_03735 [Alkalibaculum sp. M08DMB]|uniref:Anti-sigma factor RsgI-like middle domain-containing protein n=1 Tax=Alkalibaculum sporogenes TaxID=2655001 RepID=A0A6A7K6D3_9FIRM|nr:hypothetical protein [Alkalibaculum sporogenes]MPW24901.1 hypothetical protein [Alkalibaculum sporogenes]
MKEYKIEGVVIKVTESEYVLFCDDGTFRNIPLTKDNIPMMGERKTYTASTRNLAFTALSTVAVAILFIAFISYGVFQNHSKTHYIAAIDINPSIEAYLDEDLNVIKLSPLNTDGKQVVDSIDSDGMDFYQVVDLIVSQSILKGYLTTDEKGSIETTLVKVRNDSNLQWEIYLIEVIQTQLQRKSIDADVQVFNETKKFYDQSEGAGVSMNKYRHYQTLRNQGLVQDIEEVKEKSIRELLDMILEGVKRVPVEAEKGKDNSGENVKSNPESRQNQSQSTKGDQSDYKQEPSINKDVELRDTKTRNKSSSSENVTSTNQKSSEAPSNRDESSNDNEANQNAGMVDSQIHSIDNTKQKNETSKESQIPLQ